MRCVKLRVRVSILSLRFSFFKPDHLSCRLGDGLDETHRNLPVGPKDSGQTAHIISSSNFMSADFLDVNMPTCLEDLIVGETLRHLMFRSCFAQLWVGESHF